MNKIVLTALGIFSLSSFAQSQTITSLSDGQKVETAVAVPIQEAEAVVLKEEGVVEYEFSEESGFSILLKVKRLIQINTKEGISHASLIVPFYSNRYASERVEVESYEIHRAIAGKEEIISIEKASNRLVDENLYLTEIKVDDVRIGDRIAYSYVKLIENIDVIPTWNFQEDIPKLQSSYTVRIPDNLTYFITKKGDLTIRESKEVTETTRNLARSNWGTAYRFKEAVLTFEARDIPAFVYEPFMENAENSKSSIRFDLLQFQYPMSPSVVIPHEPELVAKELNKDRKFGGELKQEKYWTKTIAELNLDGLGQQEKAERIVAFVQSKIKWDQQYGYWTAVGVKKAMRQGRGNSGDINLALVGALRAAGFTAEPIVLSTQFNGKAPLLFTRFLNHVIVGVQIDQQFLVVDGTADQAVFNVLPFEDLNGEGWMITEGNQVVKVDLTPKQLSFRQEEFNVSLQATGALEGNMKTTLTRYEALAFKTKYTGNSLNQNRSEIEARSPQLFLSQGELKSLKNGDVEVSYNLRKFNFATVNAENGDLTFNPLTFYRNTENPFADPIRNHDIYLTYPSMDLYKIVIELPQGYKLKHYPTDEVLTLDKLGAKLIYEVKELEDKKIQVGLSLRMQNVVIPKKDYQELRFLYRTMQQKVLEMNVVLEKIK